MGRMALRRWPIDHWAVADTADVLGAPRTPNRIALADAPDAPGLVPTRQLDVLFVIDNSSSMREEQMALRSGFPAFIEALKAAPGGLPDVRIGIINTNFGAGQTTPSPECPPLGDRGRLQVKPGCGLDPRRRTSWRPTGRGAATSLVNWRRRFPASQIWAPAGCGYEHQLQALRRGRGQSAGQCGESGFRSCRCSTRHRHPERRRRLLRRSGSGVLSGSGSRAGRLISMRAARARLRRSAGAGHGGLPVATGGLLTPRTPGH